MAKALGIVRTGRQISSATQRSGKHLPHIGTRARCKGYHDNNRLGRYASYFRCLRIRIGHTYKNFSFAFVWIPTVGNQHVVKQQQILGLPLERNPFSLECFTNVRQCFFLDWFSISIVCIARKSLLAAEIQ